MYVSMSRYTTSIDRETNDSTPLDFLRSKKRIYFRLYLAVLRVITDKRSDYPVSGSLFLFLQLLFAARLQLPKNFRVPIYLLSFKTGFAHGFKV